MQKPIVLNINFQVIFNDQKSTNKKRIYRMFLTIKFAFFVKTIKVLHFIPFFYKKILFMQKNFYK